MIVPPFYENFGKRLLKSPKVYFTDTGLLCHLLGVDSERALGRSVFFGPIFESFAASEIVKAQLNAGRRKELYYFRDQQGFEIDFLVPLGSGRLLFLEAKATRTPDPRMADNLDRLSRNTGQYKVEKALVYMGTRRNEAGSSALRPGVSAVPVDRISRWFFGKDL